MILSVLYNMYCLVYGKDTFLIYFTERIAVGSFSGILRIYNPHHAGEGFKPEQLLLEQNLGAPILQLACGKFVT